MIAQQTNSLSLTTDPRFVGDGTWEGEIQVLKDWVLARLAWMDTQLL